jgi:mono/diheme cytochrome c family protein
MSGRGSASRAASAVTVTAYALLAAVPLLAVAVVCIVGIRPAQALPSYARQTGQECAACHNGFPELTPYGRQFKLNGYTFTGGTSNLPPIAAMAIPTFTNTRKGVEGGLVPGFGYNNDFAFTGSLFYGGKIFDGLGAFAQVTYDNVPNRIHWDNIDLRYAIPSELIGREAVFGVSANNNPTVNDVWNSTPAWSYPYLASELAPTPGFPSPRRPAEGLHNRAAPGLSRQDARGPARADLYVGHGRTIERGLDRRRHGAGLLVVSRPGRPQLSPTRTASIPAAFAFVALAVAGCSATGPPKAAAIPRSMASPAYYASQTPVAGEPGTSPEIAAGKKIFTEGVPSESVPACMACHGRERRKAMARSRVWLDSTRPISRVSWKPSRQWRGPTRSGTRTRRIWPLSRSVRSPPIWRRCEVTLAGGRCGTGLPARRMAIATASCRIAATSRAGR